MSVQEQFNPNPAFIDTESEKTPVKTIEFSLQELQERLDKPGIKYPNRQKSACKDQDFTIFMGNGNGNQRVYPKKQEAKKLCDSFEE
jgi:hypothetical protein